MSNFTFLNRVAAAFGRGGIAITLGAVWLLFTAPALAAPWQVVQGGVPAAVANHSLQPLERLASTNRLNLAIGLPGRNPDALANLLEQLYDPASTNFHQFITTEQFTESFGPSEQDYQAVITFANAHGLSVTATYPNRMIVDVSASVVEIEAAFHIALGVYQHPTENRTFYAPDVEPSLDLAVPILNISGLDNFSLPRPRFKATPLVEGQTAVPQAGSGIGGTYMGKDFRAAYVPSSPFAGAGQTVGLLEFDGYNASDISDYETKAGLPSVALSNVLLDEVNGRTNGGELEVCLDIEVAISMAPELSKIMVSEGANWHDILNRMTSDNLAKQLSCSW